MFESAQNVVTFLSISGPEVERVTHGTPYKFSLLNQSIIRSLWEIGNNFALKNPNQVRPVELERRLRGLLQDRRSILGDLKLQRYISFNSELLKSKKKVYFFFNFISLV